MKMMKNFRNEDGFSLIELLFSITVLSVGLLGIASTIPFGYKAIEQSAKRSTAASLLNEGLEKLKGYQYINLIESNFPDEVYGDIPDFPDFARTYEIRMASDVYSSPIPELKMVTITVFWRVSATNEQRIFAVTYIGQRR
ncbi:MAG: hypothetical protein A2161_12380 [Candidatus Schekmanbacteria bacterium RBG_13_48_7]|uniref:Type II secretion system protein GspI C-terminal domain-containing protein n=1 Tax=Candidatus Schekmanbacteria bacterium RBG_13_48_7 TaxID=1817878 RepID=A0A1F7RKD0_9BACT|nr:MAG: hypothetical protein A2161_12380 [Candidatus Schekmanbacteria bacterium RBG_13_48_7]